ncbi:MAG: 3-dehydroquinate synthase [Planctomycetes bacterium]|nr:3-dehydroquinate synthase [Planctomycetota bacterium]
MRHIVVDTGGTRPHGGVAVGRGLLARLGELATACVRPGVCVLVADGNVAAAGHAAPVEASLRAAGFQPTVVTLPAGEAAKDIRQVERLWGEFGAAGLDRSGVVVALGGGAASDVAGFAAATWMRGVPWIVAPTTLLAMADASVGGKTAVNLPAGKNLAGTVHMPVLVVADVATLATLPARETRSGFAEIVKCAVLADRSRIAWLRAAAPELLTGDCEAIVDLVAFSVEIKAAHVRGDADDTQGVRALLNLGHTTAHAIEAAAGYGAVLHGEAVAVGLVVAARLAGRRGLCDESLENEVVAALEACGLPVRLPAELDAVAVVARTRSDKKRVAGRTRMVLPLRVSGAALHDVADDELLAALS